MSKPLDFNKLKKRYLTVILPDEKQTTLFVGTPTKSVMDKFIALEDMFNDEDGNETAIDDLYSICAEIMSRNKANIKITKDTLLSLFDYEDIIVFIQEYTEFIREIGGSKN